MPTRIIVNSTRRCCLVLGCMLCGSIAQAAELRPFNPPIQQTRPYEQRAPEPVFAPSNYYRDFAEKTARLTPQQRQQLITIFTQRLNEATRAKKWDEASHYAQLLEILNKRSAP